MRKLLSVVLSVLLLISFVFLPADAATDYAGERQLVSVEYLDDGSFFTIEIVRDPWMTRSTTTGGSKIGTYYGAAGNAIWNVTVHGDFTYTPGVSSRATSATATIGIIDRNASFVSKNAYVSGASAYGNGMVKYKGETVSKTIVLTCDSYGNLS